MTQWQEEAYGYPEADTMHHASELRPSKPSQQDIAEANKKYSRFLTLDPNGLGSIEKKNHTRRRGPPCLRCQMQKEKARKTPPNGYTV